jgi:hypothetical protein
LIIGEKFVEFSGVLRIWRRALRLDRATDKAFAMSGQSRAGREGVRDGVDELEDVLVGDGWGLGVAGV